jgi:Rab family protein
MHDSTPQLKIVFLGDSGVGKTSIVTKYVSGTLPERINPTIGAAFLTKVITFEDQKLELLIWDTAGQEVYRGLAPMYYRSSAIAIVVFDVTVAESYNSVDYWIQELKSNVDESIVICVCGNKIDLEETRVVDSVTASGTALEKGVLYSEVSAATGAGVDKLFQLAMSKAMKVRAAAGSPETAGKILDGDLAEKRSCC